jgi:hypothetical protein
VPISVLLAYPLDQQPVLFDKPKVREWRRTMNTTSNTRLHETPYSTSAAQSVIPNYWFWTWSWVYYTLESLAEYRFYYTCLS